MIKTDSVKQVNVKDENGRILTEKVEFCERWKEYFKGLPHMSEEGSAVIRVRPGMTLRIFDKAHQNITER